jgi:AAA15 family ATPase/GTPase
MEERTHIGEPYVRGELTSKLNEFYLSNFKAFYGEHSLPIAPLTLVFGKNSSGKSAIIQAFLLMREMLLSTDNADVHSAEASGKVIDLGGFENYRNRPSDRSWEEVMLEVKFSNRRNDSQSMYAIRLGKCRCTDNQYVVVGDYGRDLKYGVTGVRIVSEGLNIDTEQNRIINNAEYGNEFCYSLLLGNLDYTESGLRYLESGLSAEDRKNQQMLNLDNVRETDRAVSLLSYELALQWLRAQKRLFSYTCNGKLAKMNTFVAGGYHIYEDEADDSVDYFPSPGSSDTREESLKSLRDFISVDCLQYLEKIGLDEDSLYQNVLRILEKDIPHRLDGLCDSAYKALLPLFRSLRYIGPIRNIPDRVITNRFKPSDSSFTASDISVYANIRDDKQLLTNVNKWLSGELFSKKYSFYNNNMGELKLYELKFNELGLHQNIEVCLQDVGSGLSQIIPVIAFCLGNTLKTLLLEQPELHLHPSGAAEMGDILIESALGDSRNTIIAETHSEHMILRILKRIRQTYEGTLPDGLPPVKPEDVSVVFVQPREDGMGSEIITVPITEEGDILFGWPEGFMPDRMKELF